MAGWLLSLLLVFLFSSHNLHGASSGFATQVWHLVSGGTTFSQLYHNFPFYNLQIPFSFEKQVLVICFRHCRSAHHASTKSSNFGPPRNVSFFFICPLLFCRKCLQYCAFVRLIVHLLKMSRASLTEGQTWEMGCGLVYASHGSLFLSHSYCSLD